MTKLRVYGILSGLAIAIGGMAPAIAGGMPLQVGGYRIGSKYIYIGNQGDRLCYSGFSGRGSLTASLNPDSQFPGLYHLQNTDLVLYQDTPDTLYFGEQHTLTPWPRDRDLNETPADLKDCLESLQPVFQQKEFRR